MSFAFQRNEVSSYWCGDFTNFSIDIAYKQLFGSYSITALVCIPWCTRSCWPAGTGFFPLDWVCCHCSSKLWSSFLRLPVTSELPSGVNTPQSALIEPGSQGKGEKGGVSISAQTGELEVSSKRKLYCLDFMNDNSASGLWFVNSKVKVLLWSTGRV